MDTTETSSRPATAMPPAPTTDMRLEVVVIPVADVDRAKSFYAKLRWRIDADFASGDGWRLVQLTPPGSPCSVMFGTGITSIAPGSGQGMMLVVDDVDATRAELVECGVDVSRVFHFDHDRIRFAGSNGRLQGPDADRRSYFSWISFSDPDGNSWLVQEVKSRLPGRGLSLDVATLTELLKAAEEGHGQFEPTGPKHHWSEWYAAFIVASERGGTAHEAARDAALYVEAAHRVHQLAAIDS